MKNVVSGLQEDWFLSFKDTDTHLDIQPGPSSLATPAKELGSVQSLSQVRLFATPWTAARQASLYITNSRSLLKFMSIELVMPSNYLILDCPLLLLP